MLPPPAAIPKPPRETTKKKYLPAVKTKPRLSLEQSRWPLSRRAADNQKYKIPSHSLIALAQSRGRRRDGQKKRLRSTKPLARSKSTALLQKMLKCSPGPCEAGVFASIVGGYSGVFGVFGSRLAFWTAWPFQTATLMLLNFNTFSIVFCSGRLGRGEPNLQEKGYSSGRSKCFILLERSHTLPQGWASTRRPPR